MANRYDDTDTDDDPDSDDMSASLGHHCCSHCPAKFLLESELERCFHLEMIVTFTQTQTQD